MDTPIRYYPVFAGLVALCLLTASGGRGDPDTLVSGSPNAIKPIDDEPSDSISDQVHEFFDKDEANAHYIVIKLIDDHECDRDLVNEALEELAKLGKCYHLLAQWNNIRHLYNHK
jgi:hypothetical protein